MNNKVNQNDNINKSRPIAAIPAIPMAWAIVSAAILLSGLSLIGSFQQPAIAQQENMTGGAAVAGNATNATMIGATGGGGAITGDGNNTTSTTAGGPTVGQGEGAGGGAAGGGGTTVSQ